ncbi:MAG: Type II secretory pathway, pullulanase PulA, partial [Pseudomonadota bacterium]
ASLRAAPYASYVTDATGLERCNRFLRFEYLAEDCAALGRDLGLTLTLPHANRSDRPADYRRSYDESSSRRVESLCQGDIARFGYAFDG